MIDPCLDLSILTEPKGSVPSQSGCNSKGKRRKGSGARQRDSEARRLKFNIRFDQERQARLHALFTPDDLVGEFTLSHMNGKFEHTQEECVEPACLRLDSEFVGETHDRCIHLTPRDVAASIPQMSALDDHEYVHLVDSAHWLFATVGDDYERICSETPQFVKPEKTLLVEHPCWNSASQIALRRNNDEVQFPWFFKRTTVSTPALTLTLCRGFSEKTPTKLTTMDIYYPSRSAISELCSIPVTGCTVNEREWLYTLCNGNQLRITDDLQLCKSPTVIAFIPPKAYFNRITTCHLFWQINQLLPSNAIIIRSMNALSVDLALRYVMCCHELNFDCHHYSPP